MSSSKAAAHAAEEPCTPQTTDASAKPLSGDEAIGMPLLANRYSLRQVIGEGAYGVVASAMDTHCSRPVVIKRIRKVLDSYPMATRVLRELKFLRMLAGHENIIQILDILIPSDRSRFNDTFVVMELMPSDLQRVIRSDTAIDEKAVAFLMFQLLRGVFYMHSAGVLHRDLKPSNILVNSECLLKICDFGLARAVFRSEEDSDADLQLWTNYVATRWYRAPELILPRSTNYTTAIDMWSCGCIFAEMILRRPLFPGKSTEHQIALITDVTGKPDMVSIKRLRSAGHQEFFSKIPAVSPKDLSTIFPANTNPGVLRLISSMLEFDPERRISAKHALMDDYFKEWRDAHGLGQPPRPLDSSEFDFEKAMRSHDKNGLASIRQELLNEIASYHPCERAEILGEERGTSFDTQTQSEVFGEAMENQLNEGTATPRPVSMPRYTVNSPLSPSETRDVEMAKFPSMPGAKI